MNERVVESSAVVLVATATAVFVAILPVLVGTVFPYGRFSLGEGLAILRVGAPFLLFFAVVFVVQRTVGTTDG